jgi:hypothetical protein
VYKAFKHFLNIFIAICWYLHETSSPHSRHVNEGTCHTVGQAFALLSSQKFTADPFRKSRTVSWITDQNTSERCLCNSETVSRLLSQISAVIFFFQIIGDQRRVLIFSWSRTLVLSCLKNRHHFLSFLPFLAPSHTHQQSACAIPPGEYFSVYKPYHRPRFTGKRTQIFMFCPTYRRRLTFTGSVQVT